MKEKIVTIVLLFKDIKYIIKSNDGKLYLDVFILESDLRRCWIIKMKILIKNIEKY
ncbi:MAG: hypothetical protein LUG60_00455 [Erysipelotrichaceae bacterium]|nr:hypothetical protein [Erysipelotrichaceae bacterium]